VRRPPARTAAVVRVDLSEPLGAIRPAPRHDEVLIVVSLRGRILGQVFVEAGAEVPPERQWQAIEAALGDEIAAAAVSQRLAAADPAGPRDRLAPQPSVAVAVCTRRRPDQLETCLASIAALTTAPAEVIVVDNSDGDPEVEAACRRHGARPVLEPVPGQARARNRALLETDAALVAFTDDDCVVDQHWLDRLGDAFADPMVACVTGYIGPLELETPSQYVFERHGGFERRARREVYDLGGVTPIRGAAVAGAGANMIFRRRALAEIGNFAEFLGPGTPARSAEDKYQFYRALAAGRRIVYEPERIVWHRHRADAGALARIFTDYGVAEFAYATHCLVRHRDPGALFIFRWWLRHVAGEMKRALTPGRGDVPLFVPRAELRGMLAGPGRLRRSIASRRAIPPLPAPQAGTAEEAAEPQPAPEARVETEPPRLTVAIATHNRRERLRHALDALGRQDLDPGLFETVVVVDGASDGSAAMARALSTPYELRVVEQENRGVAASRNRGAREARNPVVVFLDDDIELAPPALREHARAHADASGRPYVQGYYPPVMTGDSLWEASIRLWWEDHFRRKAAPGHQWSFLDILDGNSSIAVDRLEELGWFDETFPRRRQDHELGVRVLESGVPVVFRPAARGEHHVDARIETAFEVARQEGDQDVRLARRHPQAKGRLPLATVAERLRRPGSWLRLEGRAASVPPDAVLPLVRALERMGLRRRWRWVLNRALVQSYTLGAAAACGGADGLRAFLAEVGDPAQRAVETVALDAPARLALPDTARPVDLRLSHGNRAVATVEALGPNEQWDWDEVLLRAEETAGGAVALGAAMAVLLEGPDAVS